MRRLPKHPKATRYRPPPMVPVAKMPALDIDHVEIRDVFCSERLEADCWQKRTTIFAVYAPPMAELRARFGEHCQLAGRERRHLELGPNNFNPRGLALWCPVVLKGDGTRALALPPEFSQRFLCHRELEEAVRRLLGYINPRDVVRLSGLTRYRVGKIGEDIVQQYPAVLYASHCAPLSIAVDLVEASDGTGPKRAVLQVTGSDPRRGPSFILASFEMPKGGTNWTMETKIVKQLVTLLLSLRYPQDLRSVVIDGEQRLRNLMEAVLAEAAREKPVFKQVRFALDRWHVIFNVAKDLAALRRSLRKEDPDNEDLNRDLMNAQDLETEHWGLLHPERRKELRQLFGSCQELGHLHRILTAVRDIYKLSDRAAAARAFEDLCAGLTWLQRRRLKNSLAYIENHREEFLTYFDMKEETRQLYDEAYSMTGSFVEAMNGQLKLRHEAARGLGVPMLYAQMISAYGYPAVIARHDLRVKERACGALTRWARASREALSSVAIEADFDGARICALRSATAGQQSNAVLKNCAVSVRKLPVIARDGPQLRQ